MKVISLPIEFVGVLLDSSDESVQTLGNFSFMSEILDSEASKNFQTHLLQIESFEMDVNLQLVLRIWLGLILEGKGQKIILDAMHQRERCMGDYLC
jgi:hypothetical protein